MLFVETNVRTIGHKFFCIGYLSVKITLLLLSLLLLLPPLCCGTSWKWVQNLVHVL